MNEKLDKSYKLCSHKVIDALFLKKQSIKCYPFAVHYLETPLTTDKSLQFVFSVPKKRFKRAVDRNRIKRLIRETVRKSKAPLEQFLTDNQRQIAIFIVYLPTEELPYDHLLKKTAQLLTNLEQVLTIKKD